jgi:hypothetical protein
VVVLLLALGCSGGPDTEAPEVAAVEAVAAPAELVQASWMVRVSAPGAMDALMANPGWQSVFERNYQAAGQAFGAEGAASGRIHAESAALYRQAVLLQSAATIQTFKTDQRREGDPLEASYVLGLSYAVQGDEESARLELGQNGDSPLADLAERDGHWAEGGEGLLQLTSDERLFALPEVTPGTFPEVDPGPHYRVPEAGSELFVELADPVALIQAALWHEQAAIQAGGAAQTAALLAPWRLPGEDRPDLATAEPLAAEALFLSVWTEGADLAFVDALATTGDAASTVHEHASSSLYANSVEHCLTETSVDVDCLLDGSVALGRQLEAAMATAAGAEAADHRMFASFAVAGLLRAGARVADAMGDERTAAVLRVNALDRSTGAAADPNFLLSQAAWDASKRNATRAQDLLHGQITILPGLQAARVSLDALNIRVMRDNGPALPAH